MQVKSIYISDGRMKGEYKTSAEIFVPGLGAVNIMNCLSQETINRMVNEALITLQNKLSGQAVIVSPPAAASTKEAENV